MNLHHSPLRLLFSSRRTRAWVFAGFNLLWLFSSLGLAAAEVAPQNSRQPQAETDNPRFEGQVVDDKGQGLRGLEVLLLPLPSAYEESRTSTWPESPIGDSTPRAKTSTEGSFTLVAPEGLYRARLEAKGYRPMEFSLAPLIETRRLSINAPAKAEWVSVSVRCSSDPEAAPTPTEAARVVMVSRSPDRTIRFTDRSPWNRPTEKALTDSEGKARLVSGAGESRSLWAAAFGCVPGKLDIRSSSRADVVLRRGKSRWVKVQDSARRPVPNAAIVLAKSELTLAETDEEGRAELFVDPDQPLKVRVLSAFGERSTHTVAAAGADKGDAVLTLNRGKSADVRVVETESRQGIPGAWVVPRIDVTAAQQADRNGSVRFEHLPKDTFFTAYARNYVEASRRAKFDGELSLKLQPAGRIEGRVVDSAGRPVDFAELKISPTSSWTSSRASTLSAKNGTFSVAGLATEKAWKVEAAKPGLVSAKVAVPPLEAMETRVLEDLVLRLGRHAEGFVTDQDGEPVQGAEVTVQEETGQTNLRSYSKRFFETQTSFKAVSNADGRFEVRGLDVEKSYRVSASARGFATFRVAGIQLQVDGPIADLGTLILIPGAAIQGIVVDKEEQPLVGVDLSLARSERFAFNAQPLATTQSAADGSFHLLDLHPEDELSLVAGIEGYLSHEIAGLRASYNPEPIRLVMVEAARVSGQVLDSGGRPIPEAGVQGHSANPADREFGNSTATDAEGRFTLTGLAPGATTLTATGKGYQANSVTGIELTEGGHLEDLEIVLSAGSTLKVTVVDSTDSPIEGVYIRLEPEGFTMTVRNLRTGFSSGVTNESGEYTFQGLAKGSFTAHLHHKDYSGNSQRVTIENGSPQRITWSLDRGVSIRGRVLDESTGQGIFNVEVVAYQSNQSGNAETDPQGGFEIKGLTPGRYEIHAAKEGFAGGLDGKVEVPPEGLQGLEILLGPGVTVTGRVSGLPFDGLQSVEIMASSRSQRLMGTVDFEGKFSFDGVTPGEWTFSALAGQRRVKDQLRIDDNGPSREIHLEFGNSPGLEGLVLHNGEPLAGAEITLRGQSQGSGRGTTDARGRFSMEDLPEGDYYLRLTHGRRGISHQQTVTVPSDQLVLELSSARVDGRVVDAQTGEGVAGARLEWTIQGLPADRANRWRPTSATITDSSGRFHLGSLSEGTWTLKVTKDGFATLEKTLDVSGGSPIQLTLDLQPSDRFTVRVLGPNGTVPQTVRMAVLDDQDHSLATHQTTPDSEGRVNLTTLPAGRWRLFVSADDSPIVERRITAPGDGGTLQVPLGGLVQIRLDEPVDGSAKLRLTDARGELYRRWSGTGMATESSLRFGWPLDVRLAPGSWTAELILPDGSRRAETFSITETGVTTVLLSPFSSPVQ